MKQVDRGKRVGVFFWVFTLCIKHLENCKRYYYTHFADEQAEGSERFVHHIITTQTAMCINERLFCNRFHKLFI